MTLSPLMETDRLILRAWHEADRAPFAALNRDPDVMKFLGSLMSCADSDAAIERQITLMTAGEPAFWAVEEKESSRFIGCIGVKRVRFEAHFTPAYEIGWRLAKSFWGKGYATEGARAALKTAFNGWSMKEIYSFTVPANTRSQAVMKKVGMQRVEKGDFAHPNLAKDDPLSKHVLYMMGRLT